LKGVKPSAQEFDDIIIGRKHSHRRKTQQRTAQG
jgi:hypothetical protein